MQNLDFAPVYSPKSLRTQARGADTSLPGGDCQDETEGRAFPKQQMLANGKMPHYLILVRTQSEPHSSHPTGPQSGLL